MTNQQLAPLRSNITAVAPAFSDPAEAPVAGQLKR